MITERDLDRLASQVHGPAPFRSASNLCAEKIGCDKNELWAALTTEFPALRMNDFTVTRNYKPYGPHIERDNCPYLNSLILEKRGFFEEHFHQPKTGVRAVLRASNRSDYWRIEKKKEGGQISYAHSAPFGFDLSPPFMDVSNMEIIKTIIFALGALLLLGGAALFRKTKTPGPSSDLEKETYLLVFSLYSEGEKEVLERIAESEGEELPNDLTFELSQLAIWYGTEREYGTSDLQPLFLNGTPQQTERDTDVRFVLLQLRGENPELKETSTGLQRLQAVRKVLGSKPKVLKVSKRHPNSVFAERTLYRLV